MRLRFILLTISLSKPIKPLHLTHIIALLLLIVPTVLNGQDRRGPILVRPVATAPAPGSAGLFIGVNQFDDESLVDLRFAVNDAVALAHRFALELKLIPSRNTTLCLAGEPVGAEHQAMLRALKAAGARQTGAARNQIISELPRICFHGGSGDLLFMHASSHGYDDDGKAILMPSDGLDAQPALTGIPLNFFHGQMRASNADKQLLVLDACRGSASRVQRISSRNAADRFRAEVLASFKGKAVLLSCDKGQAAFEDAEFGQGVFTHFLLQGLGGKAEANPAGHITFGALASYTSKEVARWTRLHKTDEQTPYLKETSVPTLRLPLALAKPGRASEPRPEPSVRDPFAGTRR